MNKSTSIAERLLDAHVDFVIAQLEDEPLRLNIEEELDHALAAIENITLNEAATREQVKASVKTYAVDLDLHGAIPELVGDIARAIYKLDIHDRTTLNDLVSDQQFNALFEQGMAMKELRERVIKQSIGNPMYSALVSDVLYNGIKGYINDNPLTKNSQVAAGALKLGKTLLSKATPGLEQTLEDGIKRYIAVNIKASRRSTEKFIRSRLEDDTIKNRAQELWDEHKGTKVSIFRDWISERDVEEGFVTGYEYWRRLRKTDYYWTLIATGIDAFFDKYGETSLRELLDDVGIHREAMLAEAMRYAPPVITMLKKKGLLEPRIRRQLEKFYLSDACRSVLGE